MGGKEKDGRRRISLLGGGEVRLCSCSLFRFDSYVDRALDSVPT